MHRLLFPAFACATLIANANAQALQQQKAHSSKKRPFREDDLAQRRRQPFAPVPASKPRSQP